MTRSKSQYPDEVGTDLIEVAIVATQSVVMQGNDRLEAALAEHGLTRATAQALWAIDPASEPPSMKTIAQRLFCEAPNLTFVMNQLAERGLVQRVVDPHDRRSRLIRLTGEGQRIRSEIIAAAVVASPLAALSATALRQLVSILGEAVRSTPEAHAGRATVDAPGNGQPRPDQSLRNRRTAQGRQAPAGEAERGR